MVSPSIRSDRLLESLIGIIFLIPLVVFFTCTLCIDYLPIPIFAFYSFILSVSNRLCLYFYLLLSSFLSPSFHSILSFPFFPLFSLFFILLFSFLFFFSSFSPLSFPTSTSLPFSLYLLPSLYFLPFLPLLPSLPLLSSFYFPPFLLSTSLFLSIPQTNYTSLPPNIKSSFSIFPPSPACYLTHKSSPRSREPKRPKK